MCPGIHVFSAAIRQQHVHLAANHPFAMMAVVLTIVIQFNHSPTIRASCKDRRRITSLQDAYLVGGHGYEIHMLPPQSGVKNIIGSNHIRSVA